VLPSRFAREGFCLLQIMQQHFIPLSLLSAFPLLMIGLYHEVVAGLGPHSVVLHPQCITCELVSAVTHLHSYSSPLLFLLPPPPPPPSSSLFGYTRRIVPTSQSWTTSRQRMQSAPTCTTDTCSITSERAGSYTFAWETKGLAVGFRLPFSRQS
jgi:hypothetical protein